jgi:hypothetical protein
MQFANEFGRERRAGLGGGPPLDLQMRQRKLLQIALLRVDGCLYLDAAEKVVTPDPESAGFAGLTRHFGQLRGSRPRVVEDLRRSYFSAA